MAVATRRQVARTVLSLREAERAIYIDFEGTTTDPPTLLGILYEGEDRLYLEQCVLEPAFHPAARHTGPPCSTSSLEVRVTGLIEQAKVEDRRIVAWSEHDLNVVQEHLASTPEAVVGFAACYRNAIKTAAAWRRTWPEAPDWERNRLRNYLEHIDHELRPYLGQKVAHHIREVRQQLGRRRCYEDLTRTKKQFWTKILEHNRNDLEGMRSVVLLATRDLAAAEVMP